ncbi:MAG: protein kinase [Candidatus Omnitrophica bacterium]|nr:protein kinase [Candidatus Omnitrophota bacterium]
MPIVLTEGQRRRVEEFRARHKTGVLTLLFTDMVASTDLKRELGDAAGAVLIGLQQQAIRSALALFPDAEEISTAGDSFFITFHRPSDAVRFSLIVQARLRELSATTPRPLLVRIGIHMGEVFIDSGMEGPRKKDVLGIQVDAANRVMLLAVGTQILMTRSVFDNARAVLRGVEMMGLQPLAWLNHGFYRAQGVEEPFEVCEVGEESFAPLAPPPNSSKAQRFIIPDFEPVIGWHPALEVEVPTAPGWILSEKLGEGGFGEVWKAHNRNLREDRLFKFCFRADRVRSLKREVTLFRLLRETVGVHPNIVRIHDVYFEAPPYYIVMEHFQAKDLAKWWEAGGGAARIPMESRLEIVIQVAEALEVAHQAGVLHRDIKPSNILVGGTGLAPDQIRVKLTDFGIGQVAPEHLPQGFTTQGFTEIFGRTEMSSRTGTRVYMAPEVMAGRPSSIQSDVYSLGVVFYQLVIGDLSQPVITDWRDLVDDSLLAEDISSCLSGKLDARLPRASALAERLRSLEHRRRVRRDEEEKARLAAESALARRRREEEREQHALYCNAIHLASKCIEELRYSEARDLLAGCPAERRHWEWGRLQYLCNLDLATFSGHAGAVSAVAFSPDGALAATGGSDRAVRIWRTATGESAAVFEDHPARIDSILFHPDSARLATGGAEGEVTLLDLRTGTQTRVLRGHSNVVDSLSFSPDGKLLATGSWDKTARIWEVESGKQLSIYEGRSPLLVSFRGPERCLALGCWANEASIGDVWTGKQVSLLKGRFPSLGIFAAAFSPDGTSVVTGSQDGTARVWNVETGKEVQRIKGHLGAISAVAFSAEGDQVITGSTDRTVRVWDLRSAQESQILKGHGETVNCVAFSPRGDRALTGSFDKTARLWALGEDREHRRLIGHTSNVWAVGFSPDGSRIATASGETVWGSAVETAVDNSARIWDVASGRQEWVLGGHLSNVWCLSWSPEGDRLATGSADRTIRIWDTHTGEILRSLVGHEGFVMALAHSPSGDLLASGGRDSTLILWESPEGRELHRLRRHSGPVSSVAFHPSGRILATGSWDHTARIWEAESGKELACLTGHSSNIEAVAFSPDGALLATGSKDNSIRLWDPETGDQITVISNSPVSITSLAFTPDGRRLVTGCGDHSVKVWDIETGRELVRLRGHTWFVVSVDVSPDGRLAASGSSDTTTLLWPTFPWRNEEIPGEPSLPVTERMEILKRRYWRRRGMEFSGVREASIPPAQSAEPD